MESIQEQNAAEAAVVNSTQKGAETREVFQKLKEGDLEYLFMAPEQLKKPETLKKLKEADISLFVIEKPTASASGGTISGPIICGSDG